MEIEEKGRVKFKPLHNKVVVRVNKPEETTSGGLIIPQSSKASTLSGVVVAKGFDVSQLNIDNRVIFGSNSGIELVLDGEKYLLMEDLDVFGFVTM